MKITILFLALTLLPSHAQAQSSEAQYLVALSASYWRCEYVTANMGLVFGGVGRSKAEAQKDARNNCLTGSSEGMYEPSWCMFRRCGRN